MSSLQQAEREVPVPPPALPAALTRLLTAYTMVLWIEFQVSAASSRAISQIAVLAILQTLLYQLSYLGETLILLGNSCVNRTPAQAMV